MVAEKSRAEYFRKRRKETVKQFYVSLPKEKIDLLTSNLERLGLTRTAWLLEKIEQDFGEKK